ncbi:hypothetical protein PVAP13_9KG602701 [Panicum virgatum]|uniref:Uncharacterized protein n=1 Tax=Panicum virgatum TaxID=38727 RepID=A0A8T0NYP8_PANVG|nr:hypothetical protein PVAP13_9KG602701 [Panicum virgatum]
MNFVSDHFLLDLLLESSFIHEPQKLEILFWIRQIPETRQEREESGSRIEERRVRRQKADVFQGVLLLAHLVL